jgi:hypothetical protein
MHRPQFCFHSTQAPRSRCMSPTLNLLDMRGSCLFPPSLRSWLWGSTKEPDGFVVNRRKPRRLAAPFTLCSLWLGRHGRLGSVLVLWSNLTKPRLLLWASTLDRVYCSNLHLAFLATMRPALGPVRPPGLLNQAYLSLHSSDAPQC